MLATVAALHLLVLTQIAPPREVTPADAVPDEPSQGEAAPESGIRAPREVTAPAETAAPAGGWPAQPAAPATTDAAPAPAYPATGYPTPEPGPPQPVPPPPENPPLPSKPSRPAAATPAQPDATTAQPAATTAQLPLSPGEAAPVPLPRPPDAPVLPPPGAAPPPASRRLSLLSGEPLRGGSTALAWGGWSGLGIAYGQGITALDDLGAFADYDWATSELVIGLAYRRYVGKAGGWDMAGRLSAGWYSNLGSTLIDEENRSDRGIKVTPGLSVSRSGEAGVFSAVVEGPITVTWKYGAGLLFAPRLTLSFEAPVYHDVTVGFRAGAAYRAGAGEAPLKVGAAEFVFLVLAGYHLL